MQKYKDKRYTLLLIYHSIILLSCFKFKFKYIICCFHFIWKGKINLVCFYTRTCMLNIYIYLVLDIHVYECMSDKNRQHSLMRIDIAIQLWEESFWNKISILKKNWLACNECNIIFYSLQGTTLIYYSF